MKQKLLLLLLLALSFNNSFGQVLFQKTYGGVSADYGSCVRQTTDGGYIVAGTTTSFGAGNIDYYLLKTDSAGDTLWTKTYGGADVDYCNSVRQTSDGGYILIGYTSSFGLGNIDLFLVKTNATGDTLWTKTYCGINEDAGYSVEQTFDGGYIVSGYTTSFGSGVYDFYLLKTDGAGNIAWTKTYGGINNDQAYSVIQTSDSGYVMAGYTYSFGVGVNIYVVRTNSIGDTLWSRTFGGTGISIAYSVQQTNDHGFIVAGITNVSGAGNYDSYLIRTDANGDTLWTKTYGGTDDDRSYAVQVTGDGGFILAGTTKSFGTGNADVYLIRTDSNGTLVWSKAFGGAGIDESSSVSQTNDGGFIIAGSTSSFGVDSVDIYLIKTGSPGNGVCNDSSAATITTSPPAIITHPATLISSGGSLAIPLAIVGSGGAITRLCQNIGISELSNDNSFLLYPNPTSGTFVISSNRIIRGGNIQLFNLLGEKVFEEKIYLSTNEEINLKNISQGIYFVKVFDGEKYYCKKIIIEQN